MDLIWLDNKPVLHIVDTETGLGVKLKPFKVSSILPMSPDTNDIVLKQDMDSTKILKTDKEPEVQYLSEILLKSDPTYTF